MTNSTAPGFRYARLADDLEGKIREGVYRSGEKCPSLRKLHGQTGLSITTVYQAYIASMMAG
jgi:DNA-binding GntR family transcriptional regulator